MSELKDTEKAASKFDDKLHKLIKRETTRVTVAGRCLQVGARTSGCPIDDQG